MADRLSLQRTYTIAIVCATAFALCSPSVSAQSTAAKPAANEVRAYSAGGMDVDQLAEQLRRELALRPEVRIAADTRGGQILVIAPKDVHQLVSELLKSPAALKPVAEAAAAKTVPAAVVPLRRVSPAAIEATFATAWKSGEGAASNSFIAPLQGGRKARLTVDRQARKVRIEADAEALPSLRKLVQSLDTAGQKKAFANLVTLHQAEPGVVTRALELAGVERPSVAHSRQHIGQFVTMVFQPETQPQSSEQEDEMQADGQPGAILPRPQPAVADTDEELGKIGDVRVEIIEGLDQIIVSGKKRDVERVLKLIEDIERQSIETRPDVEIYYLRHVDGRALTDLVNQIYSEVFATRQGTVSITPLVKPNAVLLIGRRDNVAPVLDLIKQLDRPVPPDTQLKVFQLRFAAAVDAERTVRNFFVDRPGFGTDPRTGLGTRVLAIADFRTNALIVQASPRDTEEVANLLKSLDVETATSTNEVRVFRLNNALADEIAPILQGAVTGRPATGAAGGGIGAALQGAQPGAAGAGTSTAASPRSSSLQLLQVDGENSQMLESGILSGVQITADARGNALIVSGPPNAMPLIEALIHQLDDLPALEAQIKVFTIINGDATALSTMLQQLFGQATGNQGGGNNQLGAFAANAGAGETSLVPLRFSVDQRTNSIIASGTSGDLGVVYKILVRLDEGNIRQRITTVYRLRNAPALDVGNALNDLLTGQRQVNQLAPNLTSAFEQIEREVIVVPEIVSNSLIVSATPRFFEDIRKVVEELDRRPPMVVIQVLLAEVSLNDIDQFGIELGLQDSLLFDRGIGAIGFPFNQAGVGNNNTPASLATRNAAPAQALSNLGLGRTDANLGYGGLVLSASSDSVNILIRALQQSQRLQVLSRPQVQTLDNQPAYVQVGAQVPFITSSQLTTFGTVNSTTFQNVGVILGVTPRTSPDGMIVMEVDATKSQLGPIDQGIPISINQNGDVIRSPQIQITRAQTTVSARSGQTVILGGLITKSQTELTRRVPYVSDIPVLGRLFRFDSVTNDRAELMIILTPYIVTSEEQMAWVNQRESERMNWCLADVVAIHGETPLDSSGKFDSIGPTMYPEVESAWPPAQRLEPRPPVDIPADNPLSPASSPNMGSSDGSAAPQFIPDQSLPTPFPQPVPVPVPVPSRYPFNQSVPVGPGPGSIPIPSVPLNPNPQTGPAFGPQGVQAPRRVPSLTSPEPNTTPVSTPVPQAATDENVRPAAYYPPQQPTYYR